MPTPAPASPAPHASLDAAPTAASQQPEENQQCLSPQPSKSLATGLTLVSPGDLAREKQPVCVVMDELEQAVNGVTADPAPKKSKPRARSRKGPDAESKPHPPAKRKRKEKPSPVHDDEELGPGCSSTGTEKEKEQPKANVEDETAGPGPSSEALQAAEAKAQKARRPLFKGVPLVSPSDLGRESEPVVVVAASRRRIRNSDKEIALLGDDLPDGVRPQRVRKPMKRLIEEEVKEWAAPKARDRTRPAAPADPSKLNVLTKLFNSYLRGEGPPRHTTPQPQAQQSHAHAAVTCSAEGALHDPLHDALAETAGDAAEDSAAHIAALPAATGPKDPNELVYINDVDLSELELPQGSSASNAFYHQQLRLVKTQISRIQQQQHYVDVLEAEGWRSATSSTAARRVQLTAQLDAARADIERRKAIIRCILRLCDEPPGLKPLPEELYDEQDELDVMNVFCSCCGIYAEDEENDIIMCDGSCGCAYHEKCLQPAVVAAQLPEDDGWLCPACDCKADILNVLRESFDIELAMEDRWNKILPPAPLPARALARNPYALGGSDEGVEGSSGSQEGEEGEEDEEGEEGEGAEAAEGEEGSGKRKRPQRTRRVPNALAGSGWLAEELPSDDESDEDFSGSADEGECNTGRTKSSGAGTEDAGAEDGESGGTEEGEEADPEGDEKATTTPKPKKRSRSSKRARSSDGGASSDKPRTCSKRRGSSGGGGSGGVVGGRKSRRRGGRVDYLALHTQLFGGAPGADEDDDEDFDPDMASPM